MSALRPWLLVRRAAAHREAVASSAALLARWEERLRLLRAAGMPVDVAVELRAWETTLRHLMAAPSLTAG